jgi:hypothetical protein
VLALFVVDEHTGEVALVNGGVVVTADQRGVLQVGRAEVCPVDQVMGVGVAPVPRTPESVACGHRKVF